MNADLIELSGYLFASWVTGFCAGLIVQAFRRFFESI